MSAPNLLMIATLVPLASFLGLIFFGRRLGKASAFVATTAIGTSLAISAGALVQWLSRTGDSSAHSVQVVLYNWLPIGSSAFQVGLMVDSLTLTMFVMVTIVATLVHVFSIGYLAGDPKFSRFFAYLGLFCFSMLSLVLSASLLQLFVFWELVGICSYLLIGFWFENKGPAMASKKAMVTNRVGDAGFLIGMGLLVLHMGIGSLTLAGENGEPVLAEQVRQVAVQERAETAGPEQATVVNAFAEEATRDQDTAHLTDPFGASFLGLSWLTWAGICLFAGAVAKSAQFPLHVWLPDAMEGPTPVSALIHAATMVAAGVYLVARIFPILTLDARLVVAIIGCITLAMAALIALVQTDIKKVLAYSTISQLGYMILFLGCGGWVAGLFHLITHAFFKSCLFLGSGSVIYGCHHEQEITRMGGLWRKMPITAITFGVSVLAIAATPWFSGFYSKELGMAVVYQYAMTLTEQSSWWGQWLFWIPAITAYLTAIYMWRLWWLTFGGKPRDQHIYEHAHEAPIMTLPLIILAILAWCAGYHVLGVQQLLEHAAPAGALVASENEHAAAISGSIVWPAFLVGPVLIIILYEFGFAQLTKLRRIKAIDYGYWFLIHPVYLWLKHKMFFDELYDTVLVGGVKLSGRILAWFDRRGVDGLVNLAGRLTRYLSVFSRVFDNKVVDGAVNGAAEVAQSAGRVVMAPETGRVRFYVMSVFTVLAVGVVGVVVAYATMR